MTSFRTDIKLGERYIDEQTGFEGTATAIIFFQHGCERVDIETVVNGKIETFAFDAPRLKSVSTGIKATSTGTGGPDRSSSTLRR